MTTKARYCTSVLAVTASVREVKVDVAVISRVKVMYRRKSKYTLSNAYDKKSPVERATVQSIWTKPPGPARAAKSSGELKRLQA